MSERLHPGVHPDPDALNAFVEGALPEHERVECLAHLADCANCREVVFLAQKAAEIEEPVAAPVAPVPFWQRFLRPMAVASVAAAVLAVVSFGLYRMTRPADHQPRMIASTNTPVAIETAPATPADAQTPKLQPPQSNVRPRPVLRERGQPTASPAPAPAAAEPPVVAAEPQQLPPPAPPAPPPVVAADTNGLVALGAGVTGTVVDPVGAVIANARVELKNEDTGATYTSSTDVSGHYRVAGLPSGRYDLSVTSLGFKTFKRNGVDVQPQQIARLDPKLDIGAATESVSVTAEASLLKTESGELSRQADVTSLNQMPVSTGARGGVRAIAGSSPVYELPDKSTPASVAAKDKVVVAVDSAGAVLSSENAGKNWTRIKSAWKGKAVRVSVNANGMFELTANPASTWVSADGRHWSEARTPANSKKN